LSLWITAGWEISSYSSEESERGGASAGLGALVGLLATFAVVLLCEVAYLRIGTVAGFTQHQDDALAYVAARLGGGWISLLMTTTVLVSSAAAIWTTLLILSRSVFAMARDGLMPRALAAVHPKYGSPWVAIFAVSVPSAAVMLLAGFTASAQATLLTTVGCASLFLGATFIISGFACAVLHLRGAAGESGHVWSGVVVPAFGSAGTLVLAVRYIVTQDRTFQELAAGGFALALVFALTAGLWSRIPSQAPMAREEA
ncbi:MAG TPA: amino acid permease, partial [Candidatus Eremiobacteraceae bacterium]|nr:amino acid permease [Candidatus Eremiobacteraceae bacterium]